MDIWTHTHTILCTHFDSGAGSHSESHGILFIFQLLHSVLFAIWMRGVEGNKMRRKCKHSIVLGSFARFNYLCSSCAARFDTRVAWQMSVPPHRSRSQHIESANGDDIWIRQNKSFVASQCGRRRTHSPKQTHKNIIHAFGFSYVRKLPEQSTADGPTRQHQANEWPSNPCCSHSHSYT